MRCHLLDERAERDFKGELSKFTFVDPFESRCNGPAADSADLSLALPSPRLDTVLIYFEYFKGNFF